MKDLGLKALLRTGWLLFLLVPARVTVAELGTTRLDFMFVIIAAPCDVLTPEPVDLGTLYTTDFLKDGYGGADWKNFAIDVVNCPDQTEIVDIIFTGAPSPDGAADKFYANKGDAGNVDIELQSAVGKNLGNNQRESWPVNKATKAAKIALRARAHQMKAGEPVSAGSIDSAITATFEWK